MRSVTVLGSGNAFNYSGRAHACYLLENTDGERMLMDCGATSLQRLHQERFDFGSLSYVILTHFHGDHFLGLPFLLLQLGLLSGRREELPIYGPPGVAVKCSQLVELAYPGLDFRFPVRYHEVTAPVTIGAFRVEPYPITHRPESTGYRVSGPNGKTFAFSGDTACDENLFRLMDGVDLGIMELSMPEQTNPPTAHVSLAEVVNQRDRLNARRLVFSHIYDELAEDVRALNARRETPLGEIAEDGAVYDFD